MNAGKISSFEAGVSPRGSFFSCVHQPTLRASMALLLTTFAVLGCGGGGSEDAVSANEATTAQAQTKPGGGQVEIPPILRKKILKELDATFRNAAAVEGMDDVGLSVYDENGTLVYQNLLGNFRPDVQIPVASASKLASGLAIMRLVEQGRLSLDSKPADILPGWPQSKSGITLRHLLSFTSGMKAENICTVNAKTTLEACVDKLKDVQLEHAPGTAFDYGSTHLAVAGRMAEVVSKQAWNQLFNEQIALPLKITSAQYFARPEDSLGVNNPLIAGGLRITTDDYAKILSVVYKKGGSKGHTLISRDLFDQMLVEPYPDVVIVNSPITQTEFNYRYGLTNWLECTTPSHPGCGKFGVSSPGAFGFTPWVSWKDGYFAIVATKQDKLGAWAGGMRIQHAMKPIIKKLMAVPEFNSSSDAVVNAEQQ